MAVSIKKESISDIKSKLLRPSLTSHYLCSFTPPAKGETLTNEFFKSRGINISDADKLNTRLSLACFEASLPGSSLATIDINNDYHGVTEKHAYRRLYDDRADFTFYVDAEEYYVVHFFETWIAYCINEQYSNDRIKSHENYTYRVNFPHDYYANQMSIVKFERDYGTSSGSNTLHYNFVGAFPISISSMPVSYDASNLLKCTVSFSYQRYYFEKFINSTSTANNINAPGVAELRTANQNLARSFNENNSSNFNGTFGSSGRSNVNYYTNVDTSLFNYSNSTILNNTAFVKTFNVTQ